MKTMASFGRRRKRPREADSESYSNIYSWVSNKRISINTIIVRFTNIDFIIGIKTMFDKIKARICEYEQSHE